MASLFSKDAAIKLFCYFRQAERSVHYAVSCPRSWPLFVAYYDDKQIAIAELIGMLRGAGAVPEYAARHHPLVRHGILSALHCAASFLVNPWRSSWSFSVAELSFFSATLERLLEVLRATDLPDKDSLICLRTRCYEATYVIERKLIGMPEIRMARQVEHWFQSEYRRHVKLEDIFNGSS
jgi:hypothetical protein